MSDGTDHDEHAEVREELLAVVRAFRDKEIIPNAGRYDELDEYPEAIVEGMKELGLFGLTVPPEYGGLGLDILTYAMIVEELAYGWMSVSGFLNTHFMGCFLIKTFGTDDQKQRLLPRLATGEIRGAYSLSEPDAGSDVAAIRTRAQRDGDDYLVNGTKMWLTNGREAGLVVTLVRTDADPETKHRGLSVLLVEKEPGPAFEGITVGPNIHKLGYRGVETVELAFDDHRVPAANLLGGEEGQGFFQMMAAVELGRINISARAVGVARRAFEESIAYAQQRETFGRPIAQHQAIQFKLAEMGTKLHAAKLVCFDAARKKQRGERCDLDAGMAKLFCSETCWEICQEALRIHGGNGYASEYPIERLYRDAPLMIVGEGTSEIQKMVIGRRLLEDYAI
jgi:alkylation response protein AidB-like acyl-CoA dehydrogenase